jgi:hypothetical protein
MNVYEQILHDAERTTRATLAAARAANGAATGPPDGVPTTGASSDAVRSASRSRNLVTLANGRILSGWLSATPTASFKAHKPGQPALRLVSGERHCSKCGEWLPSKAF